VDRWKRPESVPGVDRGTARSARLGNPIPHSEASAPLPCPRLLCS
jgi:hypothetical protein